MTDDPFAGRHGRPSTYNRGCRCEACKEDSTRRKRQRRERLAGKVVLYKFEHGASGYNNWKCRCDVCVAAHSAACSTYQAKNRSALSERKKGQRQQNPAKVNSYNRQQYADVQADSVDHANRRGQVWTTQEMELVSREDLTAHEVARMLGRTYAAVRARRKMLKGYDPQPDASRVKTHGRSGYSRGCRCEICREAKKQDRAIHTGKLQRKSLAGARRGGYQWTGPELELAARDDLTISEIAARLGRSYTAITVIRSKLKHDPKTINVAGIAAARSDAMDTA